MRWRTCLACLETSRPRTWAEPLEPLSKVDRSERNNAKVKEWAETNNATMPEAVVATFKENCSLPDNDFLLSIGSCLISAQGEAV